MNFLDFCLSTKPEHSRIIDEEAEMILSANRKLKGKRYPEEMLDIKSPEMESDFFPEPEELSEEPA